LVCIGWGVGWLLNVGINAEVNRDAFEAAGMVLGGIHGGFLLLMGVIQNLALRKVR
jgi:hypothetical protein